jgi:hypothetical protein
MISRDTGTGAVLERMVIPALIVDVVAEKDGRCLIVSLKWQQISGSGTKCPVRGDLS